MIIDSNVTDAEHLPAYPASTVMLIRDRSGGDGIEVFVLQRNTNAAFAAGAYVFPGGRVDDADADHVDELEAFTPGLDDAAASARLDIDAGGLGYYVAAIRECFEEADLLLARTAGDGPLPPIDPAERHAVHNGELTMPELCRRHDLLLDVAELRYVAHWVTPLEERPRRFDTRFFLAAAPDGQRGDHDRVETIASRWVRPEVALDLCGAGELLLLPPTISSLSWLADRATVADALAVADAADPPPRIMPTIERDDAGAVTGVRLDDGTHYEL